MSGWLVESELPYPQHVSFVCFVAKVLVAASLGLSLSLRNTWIVPFYGLKKHDEPALQRRGRREHSLVNGIGELEERMIEKVN